MSILCMFAWFYISHYSGDHVPDYGRNLLRLKACINWPDTCPWRFRRHAGKRSSNILCYLFNKSLFRGDWETTTNSITQISKRHYWTVLHKWLMSWAGRSYEKQPGSMVSCITPNDKASCGLHRHLDMNILRRCHSVQPHSYTYAFIVLRSLWEVFESRHPPLLTSRGLSCFEKFHW